jgi:hypothetical protein
LILETFLAIGLLPDRLGARNPCGIQLYFETDQLQTEIQRSARGFNSESPAVPGVAYIEAAPLDKSVIRQLAEDIEQLE